MTKRSKEKNNDDAIEKNMPKKGTNIYQRKRHRPK
jgi:hypothetical protein